MPNITAWLGYKNTFAALPTASEAIRAEKAWGRIQDKPLEIAFKTPTGVTLAAQTVRIDSDNGASLAESAAGAAPKRKVDILGIKGHATLADTIIKEGYRFVYEDDLYTVVDIRTKTIGEVQAIAESSG